MTPLQNMKWKFPFIPWSSFDKIFIVFCPSRPNLYFLHNSNKFFGMFDSLKTPNVSHYPCSFFHLTARLNNWLDGSSANMVRRINWKLLVSVNSSQMSCTGPPVSMEEQTVVGMMHYYHFGWMYSHLFDLGQECVSN